MQSIKAGGLSMHFRWSALKSVPNNALPRSRCKHACCLHNDNIYVVGGKDGNVALKEIWKFHIGSYKWEKLTYRGDSLPILEGHTLVAHKRLLLLFGGGFEDDLTESCLWIINPDLQHIRRHWVETYASHPGVRRHHTAVLYDHDMYIYGGHVDIKGSKSDLWVFHTDDEEWEQVIPRQPPNTIPEGRHGHSAVVYGRDMWVLGGLTDLNTPKTDFWKFSFHTERWERIKHKYSPPHLFGHTACVVKDTMIVFGGQSPGTLNNSLWVFNFCSLRWTCVNVQGSVPSARMWHCVVPITALTLRADNSIRTSSVPYLKNKNEGSKLKRPKSSPAYSSARNQVRPDLNRNSDGNNFVSAQFIRRPMSPGSHDLKLPILMTTPREKQKEDTSPLLCNRQLSCNSVLSTGSQGKGVDNPALERELSLEEASAVTEILEFHNFQEKESPEFSGKKTSVQGASYSLNGNSTEMSEMHCFQLNQNCLESSISGNSSNYELKENMIPGQVKDSPSKRYQKRHHKHQGKTMELKELGKYKNLSSSQELVVEDLDYVENHYSVERSATPTTKNPFLDQSTDWKRNGGSLSNLNFVEMKTVRSGGQNFVGDTSGAIESKSSSMSNISETRLINSNFDSSQQKSSSLHVIPPRKNSMHCWEADDDKKLPPLHGTDSQENYQRDKSSIPSSKSMDHCGDTNQSTETFVRQEIDTPYFLMLGGKESRSSKLSQERMVVWHSTVIVRHSDINHGEFHRSSMVI
ncbi:tip elongation aberrant protein 1-like [Pecten maximus]|uniref:tip elongation aberrant protein 1-like n=1 Tax=Pecten maximus TaxID=6579 RepID=UPI0014584667|nr:tip elongation aberrant protein 1-like [Pecten maximus]